MNEQLLIYGILHEAFTRTSYAPEPETADLLHLRFPYPFFCIAAFSLSGTYKAETDSYRRTLVSIIPKYTAGLAEFPTFFYRTENHEFLLLFNYPENLSQTSILSSLMNILNSGTTAQSFGASAVPVSACPNLSLQKKRR
ncbi:MAG: hypothetical protein V8S35_08680 [Lachnospira sp.]